jgi:hypothetical protein
MPSMAGGVIVSAWDSSPRHQIAYPDVVLPEALHNKLCIIISIQPGIQVHGHAFGAHQRADPDRSICR